MEDFLQNEEIDGTFEYELNLMEFENESDEIEIVDSLCI